MLARPSEPYRRSRRDAIAIALGALALRCGIVLWGRTRFPPAEDGHFYHEVAQRIATGQGYTWLWPDGTVTFAAHYPVGYPAILGSLYAALGNSVTVAMLFNAVLGALAVFWVQRLVARSAPRWAANGAATVVAFHPSLLAYTPALMTEGVSGALVVGTGWFALWSSDTRHPWRVGLCLCLMLGVMALVRPQLILLAPVAGWLREHWRSGRWKRSAVSSALVTCGALLVVAPWSARNCARMNRCVFVSANAGWNLLIGTAAEGEGKWVSVDSIGVPTECQGVFEEAEKDRCFGAAARRRIARHPLRWLSLVPAKLARTFDDVGAPGWYLKQSGGTALSESNRERLAVSEAVFQRALILAALIVLISRSRVDSVLRWVLGVVGVAVAGPAPWLAVLFIGLFCTFGRAQRVPELAFAGAVILTTMAVHAVFFGAARYSMVVWPALAAVPFAARGIGRTSREPPLGRGAPAAPTVTSNT